MKRAGDDYWCRFDFNRRRIESLKYRITKTCVGDKTRTTVTTTGPLYWTSTSGDVKVNTIHGQVDPKERGFGHTQDGQEVTDVVSVEKGTS